VISLLHYNYFEATKHIPAIINRGRFFGLLSESPVKHQVYALSHAVQMTSAALSDDFRLLEAMCYNSARYHVEQAEMQANGSSFQNLEIVQALLLIVRHEFKDSRSTPRAWMTHGRAMRLMKLLCLDNIDAEAALAKSTDLRLPLTSSTLVEMDERRRTFWVGFDIDFFIAALTDTLPTFDPSKIFTYIPGKKAEEPPVRTYLEKLLLNPQTCRGSIFSPMVIATGLGNNALRHIHRTSGANDQGYDFWTNHYELDKRIQSYMSTSPYSQLMPIPNNDPMAAVEHLTFLGILVLIHMKAFDRAMETGFPDALAEDSRRRFETASMEIVRELRQRGTFARFQLKVCGHLGMYVTWPLYLAAKVQLLRINDPVGGVPLEAYYASLRLLESEMKNLRISTHHLDVLFDEMAEALRNH